MSDATLVYKICGGTEWAAAVAARAYTGSPDDRRDGFIHLSTGAQLRGTAARHFRNRADLLLVAFDAAGLGAGLRWEPSRGGALFPHLYGTLDPALALWTRPLALGADGVPAIPEDVP